MDHDVLTLDASPEPWLRRGWWVLAPVLLGVVLAVLVALPRQEPRPIALPIVACDEVATQERIPVCRRWLDEARLHHPIGFTRGRGEPRVGLSAAEEDALRVALAEDADRARRTHAVNLQAWSTRVTADRHTRSFFWVPLTVGGALSAGLWLLARRRRRHHARELVLSAHRLVVDGTAHALVELESLELLPVEATRRRLRLVHVEGEVVEYVLPAFDVEIDRLEWWLAEVVPPDAVRADERRGCDAAVRHARRLQRARRS